MLTEYNISLSLYRSRSRGQPGWTGCQTGSGGQEAGGAGVCEEELSVSRGSVSLSNRLAHWTSQTLTSLKATRGMCSLWRERAGVRRSLVTQCAHQQLTMIFTEMSSLWSRTSHWRAAASRPWLWRSDISSEKIFQTFENILKLSCSGLDVLVNCAGILISGSVCTMAHCYGYTYL